MEADFVIVGSGSAGSALAYRLGEAGHSVLVLEYGGSDWGPFIQMPAALSYPMNMRRYDWGFVTEPEPHLGGRRLACPRGKVLGGSSSINGMVYVRGHPRDFDTWAEIGADGWAYADVLPYFKRMETWHGPAPSDWRGTDGPLHVTRGPRANPLYHAFVEAGAAGGLRDHRRLQRREAGRLRPDGADRLARAPLVGGQRLSAAGDGAAATSRCCAASPSGWSIPRAAPSASRSRAASGARR